MTPTAHFEMARSSCPSCPEMIRRQTIDLSAPFKCPSCGQSLSASSFYSRRLVLAGEVLAGLISYLLGARGAVLLFAYLLAFVPLFIALVFLAKFFDPPKLRLSDDYSLNLS